QACDERGPAGLVRGAAAAPIIAIKVFEKPEKVAPVRVLLKDPHVSLPGRTASFIRQKEGCQTTGKVLCDLFQIHHRAGAGGTLHVYLIAVKMVIGLESLALPIVY